MTDAKRRYPAFTDEEDMYLIHLWNTAESSANAHLLFYTRYPYQKGHNLPVQVSGLRRRGHEILKFPRDVGERFAQYHRDRRKRESDTG